MAKPQVAYANFQPAVQSALKLLKTGTIAREEITSEVAESLGVDVAHVERSWTNFATKPKHRQFFDAIATVVGGPVPMLTKGNGKRGRKSVSDAFIANGAAELLALLDEVNDD